MKTAGRPSPALLAGAPVAVALLATSFGWLTAHDPQVGAAPMWTSITSVSQTETIAGVPTTVTATLGLKF